MFILPVISQAFKNSSYRQVPCCQFGFFRPQLLYPTEKALSGLLFHPFSYCAERLHKELLSSITKFNYNIRPCCNNLSSFLWPSFELLCIVTISLSIGLLHSSHNIIEAYQWVHFYLVFIIIIHSFIHSNLLWDSSSNIKDSSLLF